MTNHRQLVMARLPITVYKDDPMQTLAEWHAAWIAGHPATSEWILRERHGRWDDAKKQSHFGVPILSEPFRIENEASVAFDAKIGMLDRDGWIHKFTTTFDPRTGYATRKI